MKKRLICLIICFLMLISVSATGCSVVGDGEETTDDGSVDIDVDSSSAMTLVWYMPTENEVSEETRSKVEEQINKITKSKFKAQIKLRLFTMDKYYEAVEGVFQANADEEAQKELSQKALKAAIKEAKAEGKDTGVAISEFYELHPEWVKYMETTASTDTEVTEPETKVNELGMPEMVYPEEVANQIDIFFLGGYDRLMQYIENEWLQRLDDELSSTSKKLNQYIYDGSMAAVKTAGSGTYAIPNNTVIGEYTYLLLNKKYVDKYKYSPSDLNTVVKCETFLNDISKYEKDVLPVVGELPVTLTKYWSIDPDTLFIDHNKFNVIGAQLSDSATLGSVFSMRSLFNANPDYAVTSDFAKQMLTIRKYKDLGYIHPESEANKEYAVRVVKGGGELAEKYGDDYYMTILESPRAEYEDIFGSMIGVATYSRSLKRSMQIITYLNTNAELRNVLQYGVEGVHYQINDDGLLERLNKDYMMDINKTGNVFMAYPEEGMLKNQWEYGKAQNTAAKTVMTLGMRLKAEDFSSDSDTSVIDELRANLKTINDYSDQVYARLYGAANCEELEKAIREVAVEIAAMPIVKGVCNGTSETATPASVYNSWLEANGFLSEE